MVGSGWILSVGCGVCLVVDVLFVGLVMFFECVLDMLVMLVVG